MLGALVGMIPMRDFYQDILDIISAGGETCCIIPYGDPERENAAHATVTSRGVGDLNGLTFTYGPGARTTFDDPTIYFRNQWRLPMLPFNADDEELTTPDIAAWTRGDGADDNPFSIIAWPNVTNTGASRVLLSKWQTNEQEWLWLIRGTGDVGRLALYDESVNIEVNADTDVAVTQGVIAQLGVTYDGAGGAMAMDGVTFYENGLVVASSGNDNASYVAMEPKAQEVAVGVHSNTSANYSGLLIGGALGIAFTYRLLSATEMFNAYQVGVAAQKAQRSRLLRRV